MRKVITFMVFIMVFSNIHTLNYAKRDIESVNIAYFTPETDPEPDIDELLKTLVIEDPQDEDERSSSIRGRWRNLTAVLPVVKEHYLAAYRQDIFQESGISFPVKNGHIYDVGGTNGSGYRQRHHAHDIFVKDTNYDCMNDSNGEEYFAVSMRSAVVLSTYSDWQPDSDMKSGNHVWLYNPAQDILLYYAHLNRITVRPGDILEAGAIIGTIGRSGKNAYPTTSPTHVHVMAMKYDGRRISPYNYYQELVQISNH